MRNVLITGCGRSGTGLMAGCLKKAEYFMGNNLYGKNDANPKGFFEDESINKINEDLLEPAVRSRPPLLGRWFFYDRPVRMQR